MVSECKLTRRCEGELINNDDHHIIREWLIWTYVKREMQLWQTMGSLFLIYVLRVVFHLSSLHFKKTKKRFPSHEVEATKTIANLRIHVEREMERIKNFWILTGVMPITMASYASKIWKICVRLTNLSPPLV